MRPRWVLGVAAGVPCGWARGWTPGCLHAWVCTSMSECTCAVVAPLFTRCWFFGTPQRPYPLTRPPSPQAEVRALAKKMLRRKIKDDIIEAAYNRYALCVLCSFCCCWLLASAGCCRWVLVAAALSVLSAVLLWLVHASTHRRACCLHLSCTHLHCTTFPGPGHAGDDQIQAYG